jgi:RNA polymerase sigma-70 factor (ECF subfamily)
MSCPVLADRLRSALAQHHGLVWRSLRRFGVPAAAVDDATQQVFLTFASRLPEVWPHKERSFLLATAVRVAANVRRLVARSREVPSDAADRAPGAERDPEQLLEWKERRKLLDQMLDALPFEQRSVFVLFELEGFSLPEIAESLAIPLGTASSRLRRARRRFEALTSAQPNHGGDA